MFNYKSIKPAQGHTKGFIMWDSKNKIKLWVVLPPSQRYNIGYCPIQYRGKLKRNQMFYIPVEEAQLRFTVIIPLGGN